MKTIVYYGIPLAGKMTRLGCCAAAYGGAVETKEVERSGSTRFSRLTVHSHGVEILTISGSPWDISDWEPLLSRASALVFMVDSQRGLEESGALHAALLARVLRPEIPVAAELTKADLPRRRILSRDEVIGAYGLRSTWRILEPRKPSPAAFEWAKGVLQSSPAVE